MAREAARTVGDAPGAPHAEPLDPSGFDLLTFDCYGTLVDWEAGIVAAVRAAMDNQGAADESDPAPEPSGSLRQARSEASASANTPSSAAVLAAFGESEHVVQAERYRSYREVLELTLQRMGAALGFDPGPSARRAFAASVGDWPPFPDTVDALQRLGQRYRLGIVSNIDDNLFAATARRLGVRFDWVVTAQQVGSYKPAPGHFAEMAARSGVPADRTLHVAQSLFHDIGPASALGYATVHVNRPSLGGGSGATPPSGARADATVTSMAEVADLLLGAAE